MSLFLSLFLSSKRDDSIEIFNLIFMYNVYLLLEFTTRMRFEFEFVLGDYCIDRFALEKKDI